MRLSLVIVGILVSMAVVLGAIFLSAEPPASHGLPHPTISGMSIGGDGAARIVTVGGLAFVLQALALLLVMALIALGVTKHRRSGKFWLCLAVTAAASEFVWWQIYRGHQAFLETGQTAYVFGFPTATSWMIYGVWLSGLLLVALYVLGFNAFVYSKEDEEEFEALLKDMSDTEGTV